MLKAAASTEMGAISILTQQVSNYHAARYRAGAGRFDELTVVAAMHDADFRELLATDVQSGGRVHLFDGRSDYLDGVAQGLVWTRTQDALSRVDPDVVAVAGWAFAESLAAIDWARRHGARVVVMSESQQDDSSRNSHRELIKSRIVRMCDAALVGGRAQGEYVRQLGMPSERIFQGYDAVDNDHFSSGADLARGDAANQRRARGLPDRYVLASSRFIAKKNLPRLVAAFGDALSRTPTSHHLVILGDGPERPAVEAAIRAAGVEGNVHLPGFKTYDQLPAYYGLSEAFVHVSLAEQWGLVINEAAAAGLPLVVSRPCGAARELVEDGENGWLVDPADTGSISAALASAMRAGPGERAAMGAKSREIVSHWGPDRFADGLALAAEAAMAAPRRTLAPWDRLLLRVLSRRHISTVS